ncbi:MAG: HPr(Ser) kinase/phosphatase [Candidatus Sumerlaeia bacterium]|nr:HPr(Ser) kinase/phosphatase [Candidatus Sumerlaeia bacterium]
MARKKTKMSGNTKRLLGEVAPAKRSLTIQEFMDLTARTLEIKILAGRNGMNKVIKTSEWNRPGTAFAGFFEVFAFDRLQILGNTELSYLRSLPRRKRLHHIQRVFQYPIPCMIVTSTYPIPEELPKLAEANDVPLLKSNLSTSRFVGRLMSILEPVFAPSMSIHGGLLDVFGMGVLLVGESGVGKSECALELIQRGHRLVADDVVVLRRQSKTTIVGSSLPTTKHHMEVRGLGIINVELLFGAGAVCDEKTVDLIIWLEQWQTGKVYDRIGIDEQRRTILDVDIPEYVIPVEPGRNLSILVEVAAMNQRLKNTGFNPARSLDEQITRRMQEAATMGNRVMKPGSQ